MRLALLYRRQYAPYSKWFGRAFSELCLGNHLPELLEEALTAPDGDARQEALVLAQLTVGKMHNESSLTEPLPLSIEPYFSRNTIRVIYADRGLDEGQAADAGTVYTDLATYQDAVSRAARARKKRKGDSLQDLPFAAAISHGPA